MALQKLHTPLPYRIADTPRIRASDPLLALTAPSAAAPDPLPRPVITAESTTEGGVIKISVTATAGDGKTRSWAGASSSIAGAAREVVEKIFEDHNSAEYIKRG